MNFLWRILFLCLTSFAVRTSGLAQTTESDLIARLKGQGLYLRGFWEDNSLFFDESGKAQKTYRTLPFTECGINVSEVKLKGDGLDLKGQRVALAIDEDGRMERLPLKGKAYKGKMTIHVAGQPGADYGKALDAIFAPDLASLVPSLPAYWQAYARRHFLPKGTVEPPVQVGMNFEGKETPPDAPITENGQSAMHVGGSVTPPRVLHSVEPSFSPVARALKHSGKVQVYLWVEKDGSPTHLKLVKPAGMGLDEAALGAVETYRFAPSTRDGKPVIVDLYIDVNFEIF